MMLVRLLLTLAIALHLSGVPAAVALPCAMGGGGGHSCCMRHQTRTGGPTIGYCSCPVPAQSNESVSAVSTMAGSSEESVAPMIPITGHVGLVPAASHLLAAASSTGPDPSPPPLTAVGLRC